MLTVACCWIVHEQGYSALKLLIWFRIGTEGLVYLVVNMVRHGEYNYYYNMGMSKKALWLPILIFDMTLFAAVICCL